MATTSTAAPHEVEPVSKRSIPFRKQADSFRLRREAEAMSYVRSHTSIPIPSILDMHFGVSDHEPGWILMERVSGRQLDEAWPMMTNSARAQTISELQSYLRQLHSLRPSGSGWIGSCSGGPAYDHRLDNVSTCGPFASVAKFHDFLVGPVKNCPRPEWVSKYRNMLPDDYCIIFAHADLSWENILVDPTTGSVTGIVDWEMAGFWPEWWEYRKALFGSRPRQWWIEILKQIMKEYQPETETDMELEMF
ncbi:hypothetical protein CEP52_012817 [Fusarium oligoseptatum]|uniref:Aminoglycoside phosphotransferase domain-containing protein n=1 Tax=Fusarium oligoseptatum TaxID=2604345 RepID=A0A428SWP3_9HYPO|nr:hypothetical protein CEP52_012817 [Fusarium oligoseptatum]